MKRKLRIYMPFALNEIKRRMSYKAVFYMFIIVSLFGSFISYYLWKAIYGNAGSSSLGGLSQSEMYVYIFMVYVTTSIVSISISDWISEDIVKGTVSMNLIKPIDYRISLIVRACGDLLYNFFVPAIFIWIAVEIYKIAVLHMGLPSIANILCYLISALMSFLIYVLFDFCFAMIAFFTTYIFGLMIAKDALLSFLTGQLIPLSFFPEVIQKVFDFLPFSSMIYTPVMIYLGKYKGTELAFVMGRQLFWVVALYLIGSLVWRKVTKHLTVLGG